MARATVVQVIASAGWPHRPCRCRQDSWPPAGAAPVCRGSPGCGLPQRIACFVLRSRRLSNSASVRHRSAFPGLARADCHRVPPGRQVPPVPGACGRVCGATARDREIAAPRRPRRPWPGPGTPPPARPRRDCGRCRVSGDPAAGPFHRLAAASNSHSWRSSWPREYCSLGAPAWWRRPWRQVAMAAAACPVFAARRPAAPTQAGVRAQAVVARVAQRRASRRSPVLNDNNPRWYQADTSFGFALTAFDRRDLASRSLPCAEQKVAEIHQDVRPPRRPDRASRNSRSAVPASPWSRAAIANRCSASGWPGASLEHLAAQGDTLRLAPGLHQGHACRIASARFMS
jgi:hypothetical protein